MVPDGVRVVSALHTVSAAMLGDLDHALDEDVLVCGDRKADKQRGRRADRAHPGPALRRLRAAGDGADLESLTPLLIGINVRYKTHAGIKITGPDGERDRSSSSPAGRAARSSPAGCSTSSATTSSSSPTPATTSRSTAATSPPTPTSCTFWLADRIDERGWGLDGRHVRRHGRAARARRATSGSTSATATWRSGCERARRLRDGRAADRGARRARRGARRARRACCR